MSELREDYVQQMLAEARAEERKRCCADVCLMCDGKSKALPVERIGNEWKHLSNEFNRFLICRASAIHERAWRESQIKS